MNSKIIVPVDFSSTSHNAYLYALELAKVYQASIEVVHIQMGSFDTKDPLIIKSGKSTIEILEERLSDFAQLHPENADKNIMVGTEVKTKLIQGFTIREIVRLSKEETTTMIVMGSTGQSDVVDRIIGSVSSSVVQKAHCPVLLIPKGAKYFKYKNILFASNYESADQEILDKMIGFNNHFKAALHFIHVNIKGKDRLYDPVENVIFEKLFAEGDPDFSFNLASVISSSVIKGLFQYSDENNIDLIVLANRQRGFFESVIGESMTKKIALRTHLPILAYHI